jgi:hypothetical protein
MRTSTVVLLGVLIVVAVGAAVLFWPTPRRQAIARLKSIDGTYLEEPEPDGRRLVIVGLAGRPVTDADLAVLHDIRPLHRLILDGTNITDDSLAQLEGIEGLEDIRLCGTGVTDAGMVHLARIPTLTSVHLRNTRISDAGLAHLHGLPRLGTVNVIASRVTAAGEAELRRTTPSVKDVSRVEADD